MPTTEPMIDPAAPAAPVPTPVPVPVPETKDLTLKLPTKEDLEKIEKELKTSGGPRYKDPGADVVLYESKSWGQVEVFWALLVAIVVFHFVLSKGLGWIASLYGHGEENILVYHGIALATWWTLLVGFHHRIWCSTKSQQIDSFNDGLSGKVVAFRSGGHFIRPQLTFNETIDFKTDEVSMRASGNDAHEFSTNDPYECALDWEAIGKPIDTKEGIKRYLRFKKDIREIRIRAMIESRISLVGGMNSYAAILKNLNQFAAWISLIFGPENEISPFEKSLGMTISKPMIDNLHMTEESAKQIAQSKSKAIQLAEIVQLLTKKDVGVSPDKALEAGSLALELQTKQIIEYKGLENVQFFAPGADTHGLASLNSGGGKRKGK